MRLDAYLSRHGYGSRSEVRRRIRRGTVTLDGVVCKDAGTEAGSGRVAVDGTAVVERRLEATLLLHKPVGHACSHDQREAPLVDQLVPEPFAHLVLEPAGRLDRGTTGLLVLTTDGQLLHRLISPKRKVPKRYRVSFQGRLAGDARERCAAGFQVADETRPYLPARLEVLAKPTGAQAGTALLELVEGRFHQVKRMFHALGAQVTALHRERVGGLDLPPDLAPGAVREATSEELTALQERSASDPEDAAGGGQAGPEGEGHDRRPGSWSSG